MAKKEKFGKFVLLEQVESSSLASEHRAAKLGATGLDKIVTVHRLGPRVAASADVVKSLMDQVKFASQLQSPNILKIYGIGKVDSSYYVSYEYLEGKSLKAIFSRCRQDAFPFSVDHALLIVSKICSALEYAHSRKSEAGTRYFHGLVCPANILVSYEGEVRLRGFGYWPSRVREAQVLGGDESRYLAPEQAGGNLGDTRSDVFALGAILFETLTGEPLRNNGAAVDVAARLSQARLQSPTADDDALPKPIAQILQRALAPDPAGRYAEIQEKRKALDTLLFSGDFTPTTFNLAFFMHSLFREDIEQESKALKEEKDANYLEYLAEEPARPASGTAQDLGGTVAVLPTDTQALRADAGPADAETTIVPSPGREAPPAVRATPPASSSAAGARAAASGFTFHRDDAPRSRLPLVAGAAGLILVAGVAGVLLVRRGAGPAPPPAAPAPTTLSPEAVAAQAKVKELQERLAALEAEKAAAEAKAAEDAKKKIEAQAAAKGQAVDPAVLARAQEEARRKAQAEQERRAEEEKKRLEAEKAAEEARVAEEKRKAEEEAARIAAATPTTTLPPVTTPPTPAAPTTRPGMLVTLADAGVIPPVLEKRGVLQYPPMARRQGVQGVVELNVLVDEKGGVSDAQVVTGAEGRAGLNEAAVDYARRQRYKPATKEGVPVKVWMPLRVKFELTK